MVRTLVVLIVLGMMECVPSPAQDQQQSLGDIARQARKAKEANSKNTVAKTVITEDSLPAAKSSGSPDFSSLDHANATSSDRLQTTYASLDRAERGLDLLDRMDRTSLSKLALEGRDVDFPGRRAWEDKLYFAKQNYVSHGRDLFREAKRVLTEVQSLVADGKISMSDSHVQELTHRARQLMQDAFQTEASFQAIVLEGQDLARQSSSR